MDEFKECQEKINKSQEKVNESTHKKLDQIFTEIMDNKTDLKNIVELLSKQH